MKLIGALASPYVARVAMFADLKGIDLPMEPVGQRFERCSAVGVEAGHEGFVVASN